MARNGKTRPPDWHEMAKRSVPLVEGGGPFAVMTDLVYMKVGASDSGARARSVHPRVGGTLAAAMSVQFEMFIAEAALAYELFHWRGATPGAQTSVDLYGRGRFWWQNAEASLALSAGLNVADLVVSGVSLCSSKVLRRYK